MAYDGKSISEVTVPRLGEGDPKWCGHQVWGDRRSEDNSFALNSQWKLKVRKLWGQPKIHYWLKLYCAMWIRVTCEAGESWRLQLITTKDVSNPNQRLLPIFRHWGKLPRALAASSWYEGVPVLWAQLQQLMPSPAPNYAVSWEQGHPLRHIIDVVTQSQNIVILFQRL